MSGEIDLGTAQRLCERTARMLDALPILMVIDLQEVRFIDCRGLAALLAIKRYAECLDVPYRVVGPIESGPTKVLHVAGLDHELSLYSSLGDALRAPDRSCE